MYETYRNELRITLTLSNCLVVWHCRQPVCSAAASLRRSPPPPPRRRLLAPPPPPPPPAYAAPAAEVEVQANEPPPPLPDYDQPPCPEEGYLWTPGYWAWGGGGYYWVPGTWVQPPRVGVLWTPGYWGFVGGVYVPRRLLGTARRFLRRRELRFRLWRRGLRRRPLGRQCVRLQPAVVNVNVTVIHNTYQRDVGEQHHRQQGELQRRRRRVPPCRPPKSERRPGAACSADADAAAAHSGSGPKSGAGREGQRRSSCHRRHTAAGCVQCAGSVGAGARRARGCAPNAVSRQGQPAYGAAHPPGLHRHARSTHANGQPLGNRPAPKRSSQNSSIPSRRRTRSTRRRTSKGLQDRSLGRRSRLIAPDRLRSRFGRDSGRWLRPKA